MGKELKLLQQWPIAEDHTSELIRIFVYHQIQQSAGFMHPKNLSIHDFTYVLPEDKIADHPPAERDASRLLIYQQGNIKEDIYRNIASHLPPDSLVVFNDTKVIAARLLFQKPTGGVIEIFCLEPAAQYRDVSSAMLEKGKVLWHCLVGGASKWKHGQVLQKQISNGTEIITVEAVYKEKLSDGFLIELSWTPGALSFAEVLEYAGAIPLPPYIKRKADAGDSDRYQTVYAHYDGSVAAPTAGLHFTRKIFADFQEKKINTAYLTLHVGAGTFKPVKADQMESHEMHAEFIEVSKNTIELLVANLSKNIITVGTTSLRTIESLYWLGVKAYYGELNPAADLVQLSQWEPYEKNPTQVSAAAALLALNNWLEKNNMDKLVAKTQIIIAPGYTLQIANALVTNFHQPQSTLLLLVAAVVGENWRQVYEYALEHEFRFLSYGDGCLLWPEKSEN
jgi:S-adenosylmethionine:tRNA ribosyltransferase-isomerase